MQTPSRKRTRRVRLPQLGTAGWRQRAPNVQNHRSLAIAPALDPESSPGSGSSREKRLGRDQTLCILPWIHVFVEKWGAAYPCCSSDPSIPIGDPRKQTLDAIWNSRELRALRQRMLNGERSPECSRCYQAEQRGSWSLRRNMNQRFEHHFPRIQQTRPDGSVGELDMPYMDVRFSNLCNLKCRTCGTWSSSRWSGDARRLSPERREPALLRFHDDPVYATEQIRRLANQAEEISFAGGEPLLMQEHYDVLDWLIQHGRTQVNLCYTTNLSTLEYRGRKVLDSWKHFENVQVSVSVDAFGKRAEWLRHGTNWDTVLENLATLRRECPRVQVIVTPTVSLMNVLHLPDLHRDLVERGLIQADQFLVHNILDLPKCYRIQVLPRETKHVVRKKLSMHLLWLTREQGVARDDRACEHYRAIRKGILSADLSELVPEFLDVTARLDALRGEDFFATFPELESLAPEREAALRQC